MTDGRAAGWTVLGVLTWTADYLASRGVDTPRLDAEVLLADLLGLTRVQLYLNYDRPLTPDELAGFRERVRRRASREPTAYIIGRREFYSLDLLVNPDVLIPRPETELLVDEALRLARDVFGDQDPLRLADAATGAGAAALALAANLDRAEIWAADISPAAAETARRNAAALGLDDRVRVETGDLLQPLAGRTYHIITANPPYIPSSAFGDMQPEVRDFEPRLALDGGPDGMDLVRRLIREAADLLAPGGALLVEIWPDHADPVRREAAQAGWAEAAILPDLAGRDRVAVLTGGAG